MLFYYLQRKCKITIFFLNNRKKFVNYSRLRVKMGNAGGAGRGVCLWTRYGMWGLLEVAVEAYP